MPPFGMYQAGPCGILSRMGILTKTEGATTGFAEKPALDRDKRKVEQGDEQIALLTQLLTEQRRTNQLLEWLGGNRAPL